MSASMCGCTTDDDRGFLCCLWVDEVGTTALEYALMLGLIAASALLSYHALRWVVRDDIGGVGEAIERVGDGPDNAVPGVPDAACNRAVR